MPPIFVSLDFMNFIDIVYVVLQNAVLSVLKEASRLNPHLLRSQVEVVKHKHRSDRSVQSLVVGL